MSDNFEISWRKSPLRKVNTKELCLFCLSQAENHVVSLACLQRHLKINFKFAGLARENLTKLEKVEASLCSDCEKVVSRFSFLFQQWEKVKMEMDFYLERINQIISESSKDVQRVQTYSQKMTKDRETLTQLVFVDDFRKEIKDKSFRKKYNERVYLERTSLTKIQANLNIKKEQSEDLQDDIDQSESAFDSSRAHSPEQSDFASSSGINAELEGTSSFNVGSDSPQLEKIPLTSEFRKIKSPVVDYLNNSVGMYECPACARSFFQISKARRHYESFHLQKRYKCDICKMASYTEMHHLKKHQTTCKGPESSKPKSKIQPEYYRLNPATRFYHCNKCDKKSYTPRTIRTHFESVHLRIRYKCDICNLTSFSHSKSLVKHKITCRATLEQRLDKEQQRKKFSFLCKLCGKRFPSQRSLNRHKRFVHENAAGFKCDLCEKTFRQPIPLKFHRDSVHFGKGFCCRFCNKKLASYKRKRIHEKSCTVKNNVKTENVN